MKKHNLTGVAVLMVFTVFMVLVLQVLLSGADLIQNLTRRDQNTYDRRTAVQYITTRVRLADQAGAVTVDNSGQASTLILSQELNGQVYQTRVYCCDGYLREMFCQPDLSISPEFGEEILPMESFQVSMEDDVLRGELILPDGSKEALILLLRSEREVLP